MTGLDSLTKGIGTVLRISKPYFDLHYFFFFRGSITLNRKQKLERPFETEVGEIQYGNAAVHS